MLRRKILIAGGGTGGHLFPALAIGEEIHRRDPNAKIHYVGSTFGLEAKVFPVKDVWHTLLPIRGFQRGITILGFSRNLLLPFRIIRSLVKTSKLLNEFIPQVVIGTGGYASALPLYVASKKKKAFPIILQEQNSFPGITTRLFSDKAKKICVAFNDSQKENDNKTVLTGNPVRKGIENGNRNRGLKNFRFKENKKIIFLFGGSQGSAYLNKMMNKIVPNISNAGIQVIWQTGELEYNRYKMMNSDSVRVVPFVNNMDDAYAVSDLLICRSGALTLAEITVCGKPSILVPFPHAAGNHQTKNAKVLVDAGAAHMFLEKSLNSTDMLHAIMNLIHDKKELNKMGLASKGLGRPNATREIVDNIFEVI